MRVGSAILLMLLIAAPALRGADDDKPPVGWKVVTGGFKKQAYAIWVPTNGKTDSSESSIVSPKFGQVRVFRTVCERKDGSILAAGQILLPPKLVKAPPKVRQDFFRDMFLEEVKGTLVEEKKAKLGTMAGKEYVAETPKGMARYFVFGTGVQVFRVVFIGSKQQMESKDVDTFVKSFKRTPAKKDSTDK